MVYDKARELAQLLSNSNEYAEYKQAKEAAVKNETTKALLKEYHQLQIQAQASVVSGQKDEELLTRLQKLGELLQMNPDASAYLMAEYRLQVMLSDVYKILAEAIDIDLGALEE